MRPGPTSLTLAVVLAVWTTVLWAMRRRHARMAADPSPRAVRSSRLHDAELISTAVGVTWFAVWLITDAAGPHWLHVLSEPAALIFIAAGAALAGYAGWLGGP